MSRHSGEEEGDKSRIKRGHEYEALAAKYFSDLGFTILERNWRVGHREIDIIVRIEKLIIFVEVKSASTPLYGHPAERVDKNKIMHLSSAATQYLIAKKITGVDIRFDVVTFSNGKLEHFPSAFESPE